MIYRVLRDLSFGERIVQRGGLLKGGRLKPGAAEKLIKVGAIAEAQLPPLGILPGWKLRALRLQKYNIKTGYDLLEVNVEDLAKRMKVNPTTVRGWQAEVESWLTAKPFDPNK
jgi:hypothetical protein